MTRPMQGSALQAGLVALEPASDPRDAGAFIVALTIAVGVAETLAAVPLDESLTHLIAAQGGPRDERQAPQEGRSTRQPQRP